MNGKKLTMKYLALAGMTLITLSACTTLPESAAKARLDALQTYIGPCAAALAGDDIAQARADCILLVVIADGA